MNRKDRFFSRFLDSSWVNNAHLLSISFNKHTQPDFYPYNHNYMHGNCDSNCWFMGSKRFVTVCASLRRLLPVWDSLRQFVTAGASQTVCDCHIANPDHFCFVHSSLGNIRLLKRRIVTYYPNTNQLNTLLTCYAGKKHAWKAQKF